jgi:hypothetical protein
LDGWQWDTEEERVQAGEFAAAWSLLDDWSQYKLVPLVVERVVFDAIEGTISATLAEEALTRLREAQRRRMDGNKNRP